MGFPEKIRSLAALHRRSSASRIVTALGLAVLITAPVASAVEASGSKANLALLSSVDAIVPGQPFEVGVRFELAEDWHIYWVSSGDSGLPPRVKWNLPEGFSASALRYPVPERHHSEGDIVTNILEGEPVLLATITPPDTLAERSVTLRANVIYLVCKSMCIRDKLDLTLKLPVKSAGNQHPANAKIFERAHRALPQDASKYITVNASTTERTFSPQTKFDLTLAIDVAKGHHIQSHKPLADSFIATDVFLEPISGVSFAPPQFPKPTLREVPYLGKVSEFAGNVRVRVPAEVDEDVAEGPVRFAGVVKYQACTNAGRCYAPEAVAFNLVVNREDSRRGDAGTVKPSAPNAESDAKSGLALHDPARTTRESEPESESESDDDVERLARAFDEGFSWQPWEPGLPEQLSAGGHTVFVDFTADACDSCQANQSALFASEAFRELMRSMCVVPLRADWTGRPEDVTEELLRFGRTEPPLMLIYAPNEPDDPAELPEHLVDQVDVVLEHLRDAGRSCNCGKGGEGSDSCAAVPPSATPPVQASPAGAAPDVDAGGAPTTLLGWLAFAFIGGLILNIMPCVLPVISIKILSFVQQAGEDRKRVFRLGLLFSLGIVLSFFALASTIVALRTVFDAQVGWGFQFQSPVVVIIMTAIIFAFALSLFGVFEITLPGATVTQLSAAEEREGYLGAFLKGVLATILATPCTAPFLGTSLGFALSPATSSGLLFAIFLTAGVGMAFPYVLLTWQPAWLRFLPRPGKWMERFKQFMGFVLMATVVWLVFPLTGLIGAEGVVWTLAFLTAVALAVWILGLQTPATPIGGRLSAWCAALAIVAGGWFLCFERGSDFDQLMAQTRLCRFAMLNGVEPSGPRSPSECYPKKGSFAESIPWKPWVDGQAKQLAKDGHTVYVDFTADWCATCLANKRATVDTAAVRAVMDELCVVPLKADFTSYDPSISAMLTEFSRGGVPLNVIYPAGKPDHPIVLPEQLIGRTDLVIDSLRRAGGGDDCPCGLLGAATP